MAHFNKVILMGNLTRDPELKYLENGTSVANVGLAVNRTYNTPDGQKKEETCFVELEFWGRRAEICAEYLSKGRPLFVEGRLKQDRWEAPDGSKRSKIRVVVDNLQFLGSPPSKSQTPVAQGVSENNTQPPPNQGQNGDSPPF